MKKLTLLLVVLFSVQSQAFDESVAKIKACARGWSPKTLKSNEAIRGWLEKNVNFEKCEVSHPPKYDDGAPEVICHDNKGRRLTRISANQNCIEKNDDLKDCVLSEYSPYRQVGDNIVCNTPQENSVTPNADGSPVIGR